MNLNQFKKIVHDINSDKQLHQHMKEQRQQRRRDALESFNVSHEALVILNHPRPGTWKYFLFKWLPPVYNSCVPSTPSIGGLPAGDVCRQNSVKNRLGRSESIKKLRESRKSVAQFITTLSARKESEDGGEGCAGMRYKPESIQKLCKMTKFSKKEIQMMYRGFKQGCPSGVVSLEHFKEIYTQLFPQGDTSQYASLVFNTFDQDGNGQITFDEFVMGLSILSRGSTEDKVRWVFALYDIDCDNQLTRSDIEQVVSSMYDMMGNCKPTIEEHTISDHVDYIFEKMDKDNDGCISFEDLLASVTNDEQLQQSLSLFDTVF